MIYLAAGLVGAFLVLMVVAIRISSRMAEAEFWRVASMADMSARRQAGLYVPDDLDAPRPKRGRRMR